MIILVVSPFPITALIVLTPLIVIGALIVAARDWFKNRKT